MLFLIVIIALPTPSSYISFYFSYHFETCISSNLDSLQHDEDCRRPELNILDLPQAYHDLYPKKSYEYLVSGCINADNWFKIKRQHVSELEEVIHSKPAGQVIYVYVTTPKDDTGDRYFGFAFVSGKRMRENEAGRAVSYVRRMYTGLYDDMKTLYTDTDVELLQRLQSNPEAQTKCFTEFKCREYKTASWFYNDVGSEEYMEVIFSSSEDRSHLEGVYDFAFDEYDPVNASWPMPKKQS